MLADVNSPVSLEDLYQNCSVSLDVFSALPAVITVTSNRLSHSADENEACSALKRWFVC